MPKIKKKIIKNVLVKHKNIVSSAIEDIRSKMWAAISAAFAFVIALSWNDTIKKGVDKIIASAGIINGSSYIYSIIASVILTIICVLGIYFSSRISSKPVKK